MFAGTLMREIGTVGMAIPTMESIRIKPNRRHVKYVQNQNCLSGVWGKETRDRREKIVPDWLLVLVLLRCLNLTGPICWKALGTLPYSVPK